MTAKEVALWAQMDDLGYSDGMLHTAYRMLLDSAVALDDALLYLYDEQPSEEQFIEYIATMCQNRKV